MGVFYFLRQQLHFALQDRVGLLLVAICIFGSWFVFNYRQAKVPSSLDVNSTRIQEITMRLDALDSIQNSTTRVKIYPFNPNFITDYKGYQLGMSVLEIDRLLAYRKQDKWVNSIADFKKVTGVSDSLLNSISPYFKFPDWLSNPKPNYNKYKATNNGQKRDLNMATALDLEVVYGIGPTISKRIIALRDRLQGFSDSLQLKAVYGLSDATRAKVFDHFDLPFPRPIKKIDFETASASDLATIPGISFDLGLKIVTFRRLRDSVQSPAELLKIDGLSPQKLELITLYLQFN